MTAFRTIHGAAGLSAHELGAFGERTGGWRIERNGEALCECPHEVGARIMLNALAGVSGRNWMAAQAEALRDMSEKEAA